MGGANFFLKSNDSTHSAITPRTENITMDNEHDTERETFEFKYFRRINNICVHFHFETG